MSSFELFHLVNKGTHQYQETARQRSRRLFIGNLPRQRASTCVCPLRVRDRSVRVFTGRASERRRRSLTNIGFTHWKQPPITFLHTRRGSLRHSSPPPHSSAQERNPHTLWILFFWILMPDLIIYLALLSGSLHILSFGDERLRCGARHIRKVS